MVRERLVNLDAIELTLRVLLSGAHPDVSDSLARHVVRSAVRQSET
jgi:hypothetical protein